MSRLDWINDWVVRARNAGYNAKALADLCLVSPSQLRRYFNLVYGRPPQDWLDELRLWHAMQMICHGSSIKEAAAALHFWSSAHLSHRFKEYHGCAPTECVQIYKKRIQSTKGKLPSLDEWDNSVSETLPWRQAEHIMAVRVRFSSGERILR